MAGLKSNRKALKTASVNITERFKKNNAGMFYLKGGDLDQEISELKDDFPERIIKLNRLSEHFTEPFFETKCVVEVK